MVDRLVSDAAGETRIPAPEFRRGAATDLSTRATCRLGQVAGSPSRRARLRLDRARRAALGLLRNPPRPPRLKHPFEHRVAGFFRGMDRPQAGGVVDELHQEIVLLGVAVIDQKSRVDPATGLEPVPRVPASPASRPSTALAPPPPHLILQLSDDLLDYELLRAHALL